ncbi:Met regulon regulatory protein metJ [Cedecea neteri]|uniref:Met regulon regulatory protein metJ n=1 Tax=Cedecea neteri TaxID=158822 RepID=A0A2X2T8T0_9ENTR|nr:Met regulon regulatory protein metJ [Cedecea neteri]
MNCCVKLFCTRSPANRWPNDADLRKERSDEIPEDAKVIMRELGDRSGYVGILRLVVKASAGAFSYCLPDNRHKKGAFRAPFSFQCAKLIFSRLVR